MHIYIYIATPVAFRRVMFAGFVLPCHDLLISQEPRKLAMRPEKWVYLETPRLRPINFALAIIGLVELYNHSPRQSPKTKTKTLQIERACPGNESRSPLCAAATWFP